MITLVPIVLAQVALLTGGAPTVRGVLASEVAAQNSGNMHAFYRMYDPVVRNGNCSFHAFARSWRSTAAAAGMTGRKNYRLWYSNIHVWTDDVTGDYAFATYNMHIGRHFVGHTGPGNDSFVRRDGRWYDRFDSEDYARDCL